MLKILEELGRMEGHSAVQIYKLEQLGLVAVDFEGADGTYMKAWRCDGEGHERTSGEPLIYLCSVQEPISYDEEGNPDQWELVGFEKCLPL